MRNDDRKLAWAGIVVLAVIAAEIAWFLFVGPTDHTANQTGKAKSLFLGLSAEAWTALFTGVLTGSTILLWVETRRMASGSDEQAAKMERSIAEAAKAAVAMNDFAKGMAAAAKAMERVAYQAE